MTGVGDPAPRDEDGRLLDDLGRILDPNASVPPDAHDAALRAFHARPRDSQLLALSADSLLAVSTADANPQVRTVTFGDGTIEVELEITPLGDRCRIQLSIEPPARMLGSITTPREAKELATDEGGRAEIEDAPRGPMTVQLVSPQSQGMRFHTEWLVI